MHQISEVQKHNLTSRNFKLNAKKDHHHSLTSHCPLSKCPTFFLLSCVPLVQFFSGHSNTSWCIRILVFCLCVFVFVMLCLLYLIWLYLVRFFPLRFSASFTWFVYAWVPLGHSSMKPPKWWSFLGHLRHGSLDLGKPIQTSSYMEKHLITRLPWWPCNVAKHSYFLQNLDYVYCCIAILAIHPFPPTVLDVISGQHGVV